jgi:lambda family phage tail tape measure protein
MGDKQVKMLITANANQAQAELNKFGKSFRLVRGEIDGLIKSAAGIGALYGIGRGISTSLDASEQMQNSLRGLASVARYAGEDLGKTMQAASDLTKDGLLDIESAATSLKNLLSRGFGLDESVKLVERFKDSAAFGKQASLSLSDAVKSATEGIKNENSILVDNAGVTKNVSVMWKEYAAQIGKSVTDLTIAEKRQAEYNGILRETEAQLGNAKLAAEGLTGAKAKMRQEVFAVSAGIGDVLTPVILNLAKALNWTLQNVIRPFVGGLEIMGAKASRNAMMVGAVTDWVTSGFEGGTAAIKEEFKRLDAVLDEQAAEIVKKWEGGLAIPEIGKDSGKRRQDVVIPPQGGSKGKSAAEAAKKLAEEWQKTRASLTLDTAKMGMDEFEQKVVDLAVKVQELREKFGPSEIIDNWFAAQLKQIDVERIKQATEETKKLAEAQRAAREDAIKSQLAAVDLAERERSITREDAGQKRIALQRELLELQQRYQNQIDKLKDPAGWYAQQDAINGTRAALVDLNDEMQRLTGSETEGMARGFANYTETARTEFENGVKLAEDTASAMEGTFETVFFDGMRGQFESLGDYVDAFLRSMQQSVAQVLSQMLVKQMTNQAAGLLTGLVGAAAGAGVGGAAAGSSVYAAGTAPTAGSAFLVNAKGNAFDRGRVVPFAKGGVMLRPTTWPMADGNTALGGEAGPEGILPLQRVSGGKLGVTAAGLGSKQTVINSRPTYNIVTNNPSDVRRAIGQETARQARLLKAADRRNN